VTSFRDFTWYPF